MLDDRSKLKRQRKNVSCIVYKVDKVDDVTIN